MNMRIHVALCFLIISIAASTAQDRVPLLLQEPVLSQTQIAFSYGGDIWVVSREGGQAQRVVTGTGLGARDPHLPPIQE